MEFKWLSKISHRSALFKSFLKKLPEISASTRWGVKGLFYYMTHDGFDCLLCIEGNRFVGCLAIEKDPRENILKSWLVYTDPAMRQKGYARTLTAEAAKFAQSEGFKSAKFGGGLGAGSRVLASVQRKRKQLGLRGFKFDPKTGIVTFPRKRRGKKPL